MLLDVGSMAVIHHGEVQTGGGMFRKRSQYLVLTNTHLLRFKSQAKAAEVFPGIPTGAKHSGAIRHSRLSSQGSLPEQSSVDNCPRVHLHQVVAVYKLDDGRPYFTIEISYFDEASNTASNMSMQLNDPRELDIWLASIRSAIINSRLMDPQPFLPKTIEYVVRAVEFERDYDPNHFRMFKVVQRAAKSGARSSSDDLTKLTSNICYLVIGIHKVHLVPLPKLSKPASSTSLADQSSTSHGIVSLSSVSIQSSDDAFQLAFRIPLQPASTWYLASSSVNDIGLWIRNSADFLRPNWLEHPFSWTVPRNLDDSLLPIPALQDDHLGFDRTLTAYCVGYNIDPSNIRYTVNYSCDDSPEFELLAPNNPRRSNYTVLEFLAIMRSLRYNESFHSISFRNVKLDCLHGLLDQHGSEHLLWSTRSGHALMLPRGEQSSLLVQELQSLALKSKRLRRLDFTDCLTRKPREEDSARDPGCSICEALLPLCAQQLTNVDWITLNGIKLAEIDIDYLYAASIEKSCHFRAVDMARCGLTEVRLSLVLQGMMHQEETLESINIAGNLARLNSEQLGRQFNSFDRIRKLDLSKTQFCAGVRPFVESGTLMRWKLESLSLSGTTLNEQSVESLGAYLASNQSDTLRELRLDQCQLTGEDVATLVRSMNEGRRPPRQLHLYLSENRLEIHHNKLADSLAYSDTPSHMTMQMLDYSDERNFQCLLFAVSTNKTLQYLDISRASLPFDAGKETCNQLRHMLAVNNSLEELNISGEQAHLEAVTLGSGLSRALSGLEANRSMRVFKVEHQVLGLPGANALASVLQKNPVLQELYCDGNEISLQAFTVLVNAMKDNKTILYLPSMDRDRVWSRRRIDREVDNLRENNSPSQMSAKASVRKAISTAKMTTRSSSAKYSDRPAAAAGYTEQDVKAAVASLNQRWDFEVMRLQGYLRRNYCLAHGLPTPDEDVGSPASVGERDSRSGSLSTALKNAKLDRTPTAELDLQLGGLDGGVGKGKEKGEVVVGMEEMGDGSLDGGSEGSDIEGALMMGRKRFG